jgi:hypothetical protein
LGDVPPGRHPVGLRVLDSAGSVVAEQTAVLRKEKPAPAGIPEVKVDRERLVALVDGREYYEGRQSLRITRRTPRAADDYARRRAVGVNMCYVPVRKGGDHTFSVYLKASRPKVAVRLWIEWKYCDVQVSGQSPSVFPSLSASLA